jgi:chemotaxis protein MotB
LDMTKSTGQIKKGDSQKNKQAVSMAEVKRQIEKAKLKNLKDKLQKMVEGDAKLSQFRKQILIDITPEGLRIQIVDEKNRPMFDLGSAQLKSYTKEILHEIAKVLNEVPNRISLTGHTDATLYFGGEKGYSNWELSADRANASRRELIFGGMEEAKVLRVVGLASAVPFDKSDLFNPTNRRISIIVLNKLTEEALTAENSAAGSEDHSESQQSPTPPTSPPAQEAPAVAPPPAVKGFPESVQKILKH